MKIAVLTKEFPPNIYGGAGVHVDYLTRELAKLKGRTHRVHVYCFGDQQGISMNREIHGVKDAMPLDPHDPRHLKLLDTLTRDIGMVSSVRQADILHCHTWYTHLAGCLLKQMHRIPLVLTTHSLEPHRPWKEEQLGAGYYVSSWLEKTAYENADAVIAVSESMKRDVLRLYDVPVAKLEVIHNGIDESLYRPTSDAETVASYGIDPDKPFVLLVSRITRQKGIIHFLESTKYLKPGIQVVVCASAPDSPRFLEEVTRKMEKARAESPNELLWVPETVPVHDLIRIYSQAAVFICPSIYEPFGLINLEAMACGTPVVASAVGGIPEVVADGETGRLVPFKATSPLNSEPLDPEQFARDLAHAVNELLSHPEKLKGMGRQARQRVEEFFSWRAIAQKTLALYERLIRL